MDYLILQVNDSSVWVKFSQRRGATVDKKKETCVDVTLISVHFCPQTIFPPP